MRLAYEPKIRRNLAHLFFSETLNGYQGEAIRIKYDCPK